MTNYNITGTLLLRGVRDNGDILILFVILKHRYFLREIRRVTEEIDDRSKTVSTVDRTKILIVVNASTR